jgi:hypothetical protein
VGVGSVNVISAGNDDGVGVAEVVANGSGPAEGDAAGAAQDVARKATAAKIVKRFIWVPQECVIGVSGSLTVAQEINKLPPLGGFRVESPPIMLFLRFQ